MRRGAFATGLLSPTRGPGKYERLSWLDIQTNAMNDIGLAKALIFSAQAEGA